MRSVNDIARVEDLIRRIKALGGGGYQDVSYLRDGTIIGIGDLMFARAIYIGIYFNGCDTGADCTCCGDRWYAQGDDADGTDTPLIYDEPPETHRERFAKEGQPVCHVYRLDGSKTTYRKPMKEPAFPSGLIDPSTPEDAVRSLHNGMTLHDYFAAKAMQVLMGRSWSDAAGKFPENLHDIWATAAYKMADSMLKEREA